VGRRVRKAELLDETLKPPAQKTVPDDGDRGSDFSKASFRPSRSYEQGKPPSFCGIVTRNSGVT